MAVSSPSKPGGSRLYLLVIVLVLAAVVVYIAWPKRPDLTRFPVNEPDKYRQMVSAFTVAATKLKVGDNSKGEADLAAPYRKPTEIVPDEPAAWANLALWYLRSSKPQDAESALNRAKSLAPKSGYVEMLFGALYNTTNKQEEALPHFKRAVVLEGGNARIRYALADFMSNHGGDNAEGEVLEQWQMISNLNPSNVRALIEVAVLAAKTGKTDSLKSAIQQLKPISANWPENTRQQYLETIKSVEGGNRDTAIAAVSVLRNLAKATLSYRQGTNMLLPTVAQAGPQNGITEPLERFMSLPNPPSVPSPPDTGLSFSSERSPADNSKWSIVRLVSIVPEVTVARASPAQLPAVKQGPNVLISANGKTVRVNGGGKSYDVPFPGGPQATPPGANGILLADFSSKFRMDMAMAGAGGFRLFRQTVTGSYSDATAETKLPPEIVSGNWTGAWAVDVEQDGDLDIVLGSRTGEPTVLRNNGDKTFTVTHPFKGVSGVSGFAWADFDEDGDSDAALIDGAGTLYIFENHRSAVFTGAPAPAAGRTLAVSVCDVERKGDLNLVRLAEDGTIWRINYDPYSKSYRGIGMSLTWPNPPKDGSARLYWEDLDNNGAQDLIATGSTGTSIWLGGVRAEFTPISTLLDLKSATPSDPNPEGHIDLTGTDKDGRSAVYRAKGTKNYHWFVFWPRSQFLAEGDSTNKAGDKRINTFGVGGSVELRSGLLDQLLPIYGSQVHIGLGDYKAGDAARIYWPNGRMNSYFEIESGKRAWAEQNLGGSCPWLFAWNGKEMRFVTDILWSSPLGLRINAQGTAPVGSTLDWVKVGSDQLAPNDGYYDLRITAELWETHFFDMVKLMAVDHPADTEIYVDERFSVPPLKPQIHVLSIPKPVLKAVDDLGDDVTAIVSKKDGKFLDTFGRGEYQGVTRDHYVEVDLGPTPPREAGKPWLVAYGWTHPTDSSINVALAQGHHDPPRMIDLETPDGKGGWKVARAREGFPAGKNKTMLFDLSGLFAPGASRKVRLRTNLEVYWDYLGFATEMENVRPVTKMISPDAAELRYRGFSVINGVNTSFPETPDYNVMSGTGQRWLDLAGYYTRFGVVKELLASVDDRYVILNAGDEIALRFPECPAPPLGFRRDFIFVSDGWEKDGNFNTGFNQTVLPLPYHDDHRYSRPPSTLENDPVYKRHKHDWEVYQTRYVEPSSMRYALRPSPAR